MNFSLALTLILLSVALPGHADEAIPLPVGQPRQALAEKLSPQLVHLERALMQKQEARDKGELPPEKYQQFVDQFRAELDALMGRIQQTAEAKGLHAQILARLGEQERSQALASLDQALADDSENPPLLVAKGSILHEQKDYPAAAEHALKAWEASGRKDERAWALLKMSEGRISGARSGEPAVQLRPASDFAKLDWSIPENHDINPQALGLIRQATAARRRFDMAETWRYAQAAMNADPSSQSVQKIYEKYKVDQSRHADTVSFVEQAAKAIEAGRGAEGIAWAQRAYDRSPSDDTYGILQDVRRRSAELNVKRAEESPAKAPGPRKSSPLLPIMLITGAGLMVSGGYKIVKSKDTRASEDGINPSPYVSPEQARRNYVNSAVLVGTPIVVAGLVIGGSIILRAVAPAVGAALRGGQESARRIAASEAGAINPQSGGTVWNYIKATQPNWPGTEIPRSFEVSVKAGRLWVHPNATEHMLDFIGKVKSPEKMVSRPPIQSQVLLDSFRSALDKATSQGIRYNQILRIDRWELRINPGGKTGPLPTVVHAQYYH